MDDYWLGEIVSTKEDPGSKTFTVSITSFRPYAYTLTPVEFSVENRNHL